jgi:hypothetical protein
MADSGIRVAAYCLPCHSFFRVLSPPGGCARVAFPCVHEACATVAFLIMNLQESPLSIEDALCRWFPTAASKLTLAFGIVVLAAFIVPG